MSLLSPFPHHHPRLSTIMTSFANSWRERLYPFPNPPYPTHHKIPPPILLPLLPPPSPPANPYPLAHNPTHDPSSPTPLTSPLSFPIPCPANDIVIPPPSTHHCYTNRTLLYSLQPAIDNNYQMVTCGKDGVSKTRSILNHIKQLLQTPSP